MTFFFLIILFLLLSNECEEWKVKKVRLKEEEEKGRQYKMIHSLSSIILSRLSFAVLIFLC